MFLLDIAIAMIIFFATQKLIYTESVLAKIKKSKFSKQKYLVIRTVVIAGGLVVINILLINVNMYFLIPYIFMFLVTVGIEMNKISKEIG
ncbi:hypothetical protein [uncultured Clostridium sp.]|uniref:hypothetical protein n=1 Tax=uncultured Clostridium sp. TaxID=59620 RepID=UPI002610C070|nr:hypothetical protein [uncultured Clostridium sp.]